MKLCLFCAEEIQDAAIVCKHCGRSLDPSVADIGRQPTPQIITVVHQPQTSGGIAALLSLIIPGAGQMYRGRVGSGLVWLIVVAGSYVVFIGLGLMMHVLCIVMAASTSTSVGSAGAVAATKVKCPSCNVVQTGASKCAICGSALSANA